MNKQQIEELEKRLPVSDHVRDFLSKYVADFRADLDDNGNGTISFTMYSNCKISYDSVNGEIALNFEVILQNGYKDFFFVGQDCSYTQVFYDGAIGIQVWAVKEII